MKDDDDKIATDGSNEFKNCRAVLVMKGTTNAKPTR